MYTKNGTGIHQTTQFHPLPKTIITKNLTKTVSSGKKEAIKQGFSEGTANATIGKILSSNKEKDSK